MLRYFLLRRVSFQGILAAACVLGSASPGFTASPSPRATVVIVANRSPQVVEFQITATDGTLISRKLAPLDYVALPAIGVVPVGFLAGAEKRQYGLAPPGIYCFVAAADKRIDLTRIDLRLPDAVRSEADLAAGGVDRTKIDAVATIPVKILVDDNEVTRRESWEPRLRKRIEAASEILAASAGIRLTVIAADTWKSDNKINDFELSLQEFEHAVRPAPAAVAIGFTSQYPVRQGRQKLGATRGPLHPYILLREYGPRINERERVEVLVHELGHFLGAAHSPESNSVMRPVLGDDQVNLRRFRILFDPVNALAVNLIAQQWRDRNVRALYQIDSPTRSALADVYRVLAEADPNDPAAARYLRLLGETDFSTAARGATLVLEAIVAADSQPPRAGPQELSDQRTDRYIRAAAAAATRLPPESSVDSLLLGLAVALGEQPSPSLLLAGKQSAPLLSARPTASGEEVVLKRFVTAAALARMGGPAAMEAAGLARQVNQLRSGGSFSFTELTAELAGIRFASALSSGTIRIPTIAEGFSMKQYLPPRDDQTALSAAEFAGQYGTIYDPRFQRELERIRREVGKL